MSKMENKDQKLSNLKKENPFRVPEKYFDDFPAKMQMRLEAEKIILPEKENKIIRYLKPVIGLAASFILIFMLVYWPVKNFLPTQGKDDSSKTSTEITDNEYLSMMEGIDEDSFYDLIDGQEDTDELGNKELTDEELINYISSNVSEYEIYLAYNY